MNTHQVTKAWQPGFLAMLPAIENYARFQFRALPGCERDEAIQEAIAAACVSYRRLAVQGRLQVAYPSTIATYAVRHVRNGRHVGGQQDAAGDALSPVVRRRHGIRVHSYDSQGQADDTDWRGAFVAEKRESIPDTAAFRIDFPAWLRSVGRRDRRIIKSLIRGKRPSEIADELGTSRGRISQLRRRYECLWQQFHAEPTVASKAS